MADDPLDHMRERAKQFQPLSDLTHDAEMRSNLRKWADDVEAELEALEAQLRERSTRNSPNL